MGNRKEEGPPQFPGFTINILPTGHVEVTASWGESTEKVVHEMGLALWAIQTGKMRGIFENAIRLHAAHSGDVQAGERILAALRGHFQTTRKFSEDDEPLVDPLGALLP